MLGGLGLLHRALTFPVAVQSALQAGPGGGWGAGLGACGVCWRAGNSPAFIPRVGQRGPKVTSTSAVAASDRGDGDGCANAFVYGLRMCPEHSTTLLLLCNRACQVGVVFVCPRNRGEIGFLCF